MVVDLVIRRDGVYWEARAPKYQVFAFGHSRLDSIQNLVVALLLEMAMLVDDRKLSFSDNSEIKFRVLDERVAG